MAPSRIRLPGFEECGYPRMTPEKADRPLVVRGTEMLPSDPSRIRRQTLARITLDSMVQFVALLDAQGTVLDINKVALDAVGITLADVEGKPFWTTLWWQVSEEINATLRASILRAAQGEAVRWDAEIYGRAGGSETITIDASLSPVLDDHGTVVFICAEGRDITEKRAQEREIARQNIAGARAAAERANQAKDEFLAILGHELRNPLSPILTAVEIIKMRGVPEVEHERLVIERQVAHITRLVDDLLDVSRIARGKVELKTEIVELAEVVAKAIEMASPLLERRSHMLTAAVPDGLRVTGDMTRLSQVAANLLTNAAKYTPPGGSIAVRAEQTDAEVTLSVRDTGIGIAPDALPHIFDLFVQERQAVDQSQGGLGIGLTIVRSLVERHGGSVSARSEGQGKGSEFIVRLPRTVRT
ncbi:hypothetical protein BH24ACI5_BH24ACI5_21970 [soil metagenome]